ncbi:neprilysin-1-like isoform X1 [Dermacentor albipictus]|uniref:neprilysin-1-like isoform X1 n=1 Tax=Dermacentor albipictus TaxID=60249 RepID=UPI0031FDBC27
MKKGQPVKKPEEKSKEETPEEETVEEQTEAPEEEENEGDEEERTGGHEKSSRRTSGSKSHDSPEKSVSRSRKGSKKSIVSADAGDHRTGLSTEKEDATGSSGKHRARSSITSKESKHAKGEGHEETEAEATEHPEEETEGQQPEENEETGATTTKGSAVKETSRGSRKGSRKGSSRATQEGTTKVSGEDTAGEMGSKQGSEGSTKESAAATEAPASGEQTAAEESGENEEGTGQGSRKTRTGSTHESGQGSTEYPESASGAGKGTSDEKAISTPPSISLDRPEKKLPPAAEPPKRSFFDFFRRKPAAETAAAAPLESAKPMNDASVVPTDATKATAEAPQPPQRIGLRWPFFPKPASGASTPSKPPPSQQPPSAPPATEPKPSFFSRYFASAGKPTPAPVAPPGKPLPPVVPLPVSAANLAPTSAWRKDAAGSIVKPGEEPELDIPEDLGSTPALRVARLEKKTDSDAAQSDASGTPRKDSVASGAESDSEGAAGQGGNGQSQKPFEEIVKEEMLNVTDEPKTSVLIPGPPLSEAPRRHIPTLEERMERRLAGMKAALRVYTVLCFVVLVIGMAIMVACAFKFFGCFNPSLFPTMNKILENTTCYTNDCKEFVNVFTESMTDSILPCEDFYEHVCGGWLRRNKVPRHRYLTSTRLEAQWAVEGSIIESLNSTPVSYTDQHAVQKAIALYIGCTSMGLRNTKGTKPLENLLDKYGIPRWPILHEQFQLDVMRALADMIRDLGLSAIVSVRVAPDSHDTRKHIVYLGQPEFAVERSVLRSPFGSPYFRIRHRYKLFIFRSAQIMGSTVAAAELVVNDIVQFEGKLAAMRWTNFLNTILRDAQVTLEKSDRIILSNRQYLLRLRNILAEEKAYVVANYLAWRVVELMGPLTNERMRRCRFRFDRYRYSQFEVPPLSRECYEHTARYMKFAVAKILYDQVPERTLERHTKVQLVAEEIKDAFAVWLDLTTWMTDSNKKLAAFKLRDVQVNPGSPHWVMSESDLDDYYRRIPNLKREEFFAASLAVMKEKVLNDFFKLRRHGHAPDFGWVESQPQADPIFQYLGNYMLLPEGVIHKPFFWVETSPSINFGALGSIIAYYLTLGFGAYGSMYNHKGVLDDWWSGMTRRQYGAESVCFKKQVEWFTNPFTGEEINGTVNQDELVADNAAIKEAFKAYRVYMTKYEEYYKMVLIPGLETYNQDQIFFFAYAMTMCEKIRGRAFYYDLHPKKLVPNHHRTNLALMNFDRFAVAFDCPLGSPMNPELKCDVY